MFNSTASRSRSHSATIDLTQDQRWIALKQDLHLRLIQAVDHAALRNMEEAQIRTELRHGAEELFRLRPDLLSLSERNRLIEEVVDETLGFGPLEPFLRDPTISDILINGPDTIYVERDGQLELTAITFSDEKHLLSTIQKIVGRVGRRIDESSAMVDARLPDGSRVNAIIPPLAVDGGLVSIRRFRDDALTKEDLVTNGTLSLEMLTFLGACVSARINIVISGGTGSGKTTLLNVLSGFIHRAERVVTIEDTAELRLRQPHVARLETRPPNVEGSGEYSARDLLRNALRMRPDRIIMGECRGSETFDMLQAMNTGHEGGMTTLHANSTKDAIHRLKMLIGTANLDLSPIDVVEHLASSIQIVVQVARLNGGVRKVVQISEIIGTQDNSVIQQDLFTFKQRGNDSSGVATGEFAAIGNVPHVAKKIESLGVPLNPQLFAAQRL